MASLQKKGNSWNCQFMYNGRRHTYTLGDVSDREAGLAAAGVDKVLLRLQQGLLHLPPTLDIVTFVRNDGKPPEIPQSREDITLGQLRDRYIATHSNGTLEKTTLDGIKIHFKHLVDTLGDKLPAPQLSLSHLQQHVDRRAKMKGIGGKLSPATIKKEIVTLRTAWNWGTHMTLVKGKFPNRGLRYPKFEEKLPFQTWAEIDRRITAGGLTGKQVSDLWDCLYLRLEEIETLLDHVKMTAMQPWVYPMFCFAAHTGARRSEMIRSQIMDVDFEGQTILIHEKKRKKGRTTTRRVSMSPFLANVLKEWLAVHPGGQSLFSQRAKVARSKTKRTSATNVTRDEAHDHFKRTLAESKWKVIRGWHVFRHSFISLCASRGVDQRVIDEWVGHQTEEQRKRYRHLLPSIQQEAIRSVFGKQPVPLNA
jgi:integrase